MIKGYEKYSQQFDQYMNSDEKVYGKNISHAEVVAAKYNDRRMHTRLCVHTTQENQLGAHVPAKNTNRMVKPEDNRFVLHKASV